MIEVVNEILNVIGFLLLAFAPSFIVMIVLCVVIFALLESDGEKDHITILIVLCICGMFLTFTFFVLLSRWVFF